MVDIIISEFMDNTAVEGLAEDFDVLYDPGLVDRRDHLISILAAARALIVRNRTAVDVELLETGRSLEVIGRLGVGLDNIDVSACASRHIEVRSAGGANADAVAEYVIAAVLLLVRGVFHVTDDVAGGTWPRTRLIGGEVAGRTLGLIGFGTVAQRVARRAIDLGMDVIANDPYLDPADEAWSTVRRVALGDVTGTADAVSVHVPLTESTRKMISRDVLASMKPTAVLVNTSRGGVVDEQAVLDALVAGNLRGAVLDVFETEPVTAETGGRFAGVPNLILTPHIAGITEESNARVGEAVATAVRDVLTGANR